MGVYPILPLLKPVLQNLQTFMVKEGFGPKGPRKILPLFEIIIPRIGWNLLLTYSTSWKLGKPLSFYSIPKGFLGIGQLFLQPGKIS